jgi:hypothetical protein
MTTSMSTPTSMGAVGWLATVSRPLSWADGELVRFLPPLARLVLWGALGAFVSMELYRRVSPQARIKAVEADVQEIRRRLDRHEGSFGEGWSLVRDMLSLSARRIVLVGPAAVLASLPLLVIVIWMASAYQGARVLEIGPAWVGGWEVTFFAAVTVFAATLKVVRRIA